jgi:hypothetical protein
MKRIWLCLAAAMAGGAMVSGQGDEAARVLADARSALGGDKLAAVRTLTATGRSLRTGPGGNTVENEFELAMELPDKYLLRSVLAAMGNMSVYRHTGFNGDQVIEEIDRPPNLSGGTMIVRFAGPGGTSMDPDKMTPEQKAELDRTRLLNNRRDFTRLALGMFATSFPVFPLQFTHAGQAEAPDGKADVLDVKGEGGFAARLFVDARTHLPLMLTWMDKEPLVLTMGPGGTTTSGPGGTQVVRSVGGPGGPQAMSKEQREKFEKDLDERRKEAEAKRRTVEFRMYYSDYQAVGGAVLPHRVQRSIDGKPAEEMIFDEFKVNPKIDAKKFKPAG